jgi:hypothetical protein
MRLAGVNAHWQTTGTVVGVHWPIEGSILTAIIQTIIEILHHDFLRFLRQFPVFSSMTGFWHKQLCGLFTNMNIFKTKYV